MVLELYWQYECVFKKLRGLFYKSVAGRDVCVDSQMVLVVGEGWLGAVRRWSWRVLELVKAVATIQWMV